MATRKQLADRIRIVGRLVQDDDGWAGAFAVAIARHRPPSARAPSEGDVQAWASGDVAVPGWVMGTVVPLLTEIREQWDREDEDSGDDEGQE